jgi:Cu(I)-responsive transcriptional regulator
MSGQAIGIGELARATGCKVQTIRYYEEIGLMPEPARTVGNQRRYDQRHVDRLAFIRHGRELGFSLEAIRELLSLSDRPDQPCDAVDRLARRQLEQVERRLARLMMLRSELERMLEQCAGGKVRDCRVIEALSDHSERSAGVTMLRSAGATSEP